MYIFNKTSIDKFEFLQGYRREWTKYNTTKNSHYYHRVKPIFLNNGYVDTGLKTDYIKKSMHNDSYEFAINYLYSDTGNIYTRFEESFRTPAPTEFQDKDGTDYILNDLKPETNQTLEIGI
ncbi:MAG: TonB-dependent receptor domain-containing protein, partial [Cetobacterium sp.]